MAYRSAPRAALFAFATMVAATAAQAQMGGRNVVAISGAPAGAVTPGKAFTLNVTLKVKAGYHIQSNKPAPNYIPTVLTVTAPAGWKVGAPKFPAAGSMLVAGENVPVFGGKVVVKVPVTPPKNAASSARLALKVRYQACTDLSCFPPTENAGAATVKVRKPPARAGAPPDAAVAAAQPPGPLPGGGIPPGYSAARIEQFVPPDKFIEFLTAGSGSDAGAGALGRLLQGGNLALALPLVFLLGLALNLTPCVYPLIPITVGYFGGQSQTGTKPIVLAVYYLLGMALMYSALGAIAGATRGLFGAQLQNPWVQLGFAGVMFAMALTQFDRRNGMPIWEFQLPASLRNRSQARSGALGAVIMGLMVGVVAAPCVGPAVVALLQWVGTHGNPALGFLVFFVMALGLGLPYLFLASASGAITRLPRSGEWMNGVKHVFGTMMALMGFYYLQGPLNSLRPGLGHTVMLAALALAGIYLLAIDRAGARSRVFTGVRRVIGLAAIAAVVWLARPAPAQAIKWSPYTDAAMEQAVRERRKILVDFTADWCAACRELEHKTFSKPEVGAAASDYLALRADLSSESELDRLAKRYNLVGLPTVLRMVPADGAQARR